MNGRYLLDTTIVIAVFARDEFMAATVVLPCDVGAARRYGEVKDKLRQKGRPIPENDIWIAATAIQHDLTLAARDAHFDEVEGLKVERW